MPKCKVCGFEDELAVERHHIIPKYLGGGDEESNLIWLCANCHRRISVVSSKFRKWFNKWYKHGVIRRFEEFPLYQKLPPQLQEIITLELNKWIEKRLSLRK
jgi:hypothetical protein